ncbi:MAG: YraN family protein, partial [Alphaproteobacteria bacterium]|nr:YraN family protein [Alphaproteobacteria bacterium]
GGRGTGAGEVDIVVRRGRVLAFVEVKARPDATTAIEAVGPRQQARIRRGAESFLKRRPDLLECLIRFDVMAVAPWRWPLHLTDAWR